MLAQLEHGILTKFHATANFKVAECFKLHLFRYSLCMWRDTGKIYCSFYLMFLCYLDFVVNFLFNKAFCLIA